MKVCQKVSIILSLGVRVGNDDSWQYNFCHILYFLKFINLLAVTIQQSEKEMYTLWILFR